MSEKPFKTVPMDIPEEMAPAVRRDVMAFLAKRRVALAAELSAVKENERAFKTATGQSVGNAAGGNKRASKKQVMERIIADLGLASSSIQGSTVSDLADRLGTSYGTTHRAVEKLIEDGKVDKGPDNRIRLVEEFASTQ